MANHLELKSSYYYDGGAPAMSGISLPKAMDAHNIYVSKDPSLEFKTKSLASSHVSETIIEGLGEELKLICESDNVKNLSSQINKAFDESGICSVGICAKQLEGYDFNTSNSYKKGVNAEFFIKSGSDKSHVIFHIPSFVPTEDLLIPKRATNFKIITRLVSSSDLHDIGGRFRLTEPKQDRKVGVFKTSMLPILKTSTEPMTAQLRLLNTGIIRNNVSTVLIVGFKFYEYANRKFTSLDKEGMMSIVKVF